MEKTLVLIKPDAISKNLSGEIINIYLKNHLKISNIKMLKATDQILDEHYKEHVEKEFYKSLRDFMKRGKIIAIVLEGHNAVNKAREINGATDPKKASPNTIRYLYGSAVQRNAVHGSANLEDAKREIKIWFGDNEK
jgi:nucleoside-diphosphate kinase